MRTSVFVLLLVSAITLPTWAISAEPPFDTLKTVDEILDRYIEAVGGREALEKLHTRISKGQVVNDLSWHDPQLEVVPMEIYSRTPDRVLMVEHHEGFVKRIGFDGDQGWHEDTSGVRPDFYIGKGKLDFICNPQNALRVREHFGALARKPLGKIDGRPVYVLEPTKLKKLHYALYFDVVTGLLVRIGTYWDIKDYRRVDGVLVPHKIVTSRKGGSTSFVFDEVKFNLPIDDGMFRHPDTGKK